MIIKEFEINHSIGLHARPAALFVQNTNRFLSDIFVEYNGDKINGKSIMGLMTLAVPSKAKIILEINGIDENEAMKAMEDFLNNKMLQI